MPLGNPAYEPSDVAACEQLDLASFGLPELMANDRSVAPAVAGLGPEPTSKFRDCHRALWALILWKRDTRYELLVDWLSWWVDVVGLSNVSGFDILTRTLDPYSHIAI